MNELNRFVCAQDRLTKEKAEWQRERLMQEEQINEQRKQLAKLQDKVRLENADVQQQRENLYQKLGALRGQGITLSPNMTIVSTAPPIGAAISSSSCTSPAEDTDQALSAASPPPPSSSINSSSSSSSSGGTSSTSGGGGGHHNNNILSSPTPSAASTDLGRRRTSKTFDVNSSDIIFIVFNFMFF